jgi:hypothetical protein
MPEQNPEGPRAPEPKNGNGVPPFDACNGIVCGKPGAGRNGKVLARGSGAWTDGSDAF